MRQKHDLFSGDLEERPLSKELPNLGIGTSLSLCFKGVGTPFEHKSYFIQITLDGVHWILRFAAPQELKSRGRVILETTQRQYEATEEKSVPATVEILERLNNVLSATNFSYCLRNSEHLARYIVEGYWHSLQMMREGEMRQFFGPILQPNHLRLVASLPSDLLAKETLIDAAPLFDSAEMINYDHFVSVEDFKLTGDAYNIVIAGPTGAGKSTLANIFFNASVSKTDDNVDAVSVTRTFHVVHGNYRCDDNRRLNVNVVDTMGLCDLFVEDEEAVQLLSGAILTEHSKIDKVVIVLSETPITVAHKLAIKNLLKKLSYKENKENFVFLYNKTEGLNESTKMELLVKMGEELGVDVDFKIPVAMPGQGGTLETTTHFRAGEAIGTDVADFNNPESRHTIDVLKNNLLPHCSTVLRSPKRMTVKSACTIQ